MYTFLLKVCTVQFKLYSVLRSVQCVLCTVQCTVCIVYCTVYSVQCSAVTGDQWVTPPSVVTLAHNGGGVRLHYNTLLCNTLHYNTLLCNTLHYNRLLCNTLHYNTLLCNTLHYNTLLCNTLHYNTLLCNTLHYNTLLCNTLHYNRLLCNTLHYNTLLCNTLHYNTLLCNTLHYNTLLCNTPLYITIHYDTLHSNTIHYNTLLCNIIHYNTLLCDTILYNTLVCNTILYNTLVCNTIFYITLLCSGSSSGEHPWECFSWYKANAVHCAIILTLDWANLPEALIFYFVIVLWYRKVRKFLLAYFHYFNRFYKTKLNPEPIVSEFLVTLSLFSFFILFTQAGAIAALPPRPPGLLLSFVTVLIFLIMTCRQCLNEFQKEYCINTKVIALDWKWVTDNEWPLDHGAKWTVTVIALQSSIRLKANHIKVWINWR